MRRLDSVTRSPLYSIYGETISGVTILRAFGAGSKFLRDMLRDVDTNANPYFWMFVHLLSHGSYVMTIILTFLGGE